MNKIFSFKILISIFLGVIFIIPSFSNAQTADELRANVSDLTSKINALDKEIKEYNTKISQTQGEAKTLKQALANLENQRIKLTKQIEKTNLQIKETEKEISKTGQALVVTQGKISFNSNALEETLRTLNFQDTGMSPFVISLAKNAHFSDALDQMEKSKSLSHAIDEQVRNLQYAKTDLENTKKDYEDTKSILVDLNSTLTDQKVLVDQTKQNKNKLLIETKNKESTYQAMLADRKKKKGELEAEMLDVESKLKVFVDSGKLPSAGKGVLQYPVENVKITQYFGNTPFSTQNPQVYNGMGHNGVDFGVQIGTSIYSSEAGTVIGTGNTDTACSGVSYGKWVLIRHYNGLTTLYAHLSVINVVQGQSITSKQKIGLSGNTGYSTGPHLHYTVYASDSVHVSGPTEYKSRVCGTYMIMPLAPRAGYLNPLSYL